MKSKQAKIWDSAFVPTELTNIHIGDVYDVTMLGWMEGMLKGNTKRITGIVSGYNQKRTGKAWGDFRLKCAPSHIMIDYDVSSNSKLTRRIVDYVRIVEPCEYIGKFCVKLPLIGVVRLGWFEMKLQK